MPEEKLVELVVTGGTVRIGGVAKFKIHRKGEVIKVPESTAKDLIRGGLAAPRAPKGAPAKPPAPPAKNLAVVAYRGPTEAEKTFVLLKDGEEVARKVSTPAGVLEFLKEKGFEGVEPAFKDEDADGEGDGPLATVYQTDKKDHVLVVVVDADEEKVLAHGQVKAGQEAEFLEKKGFKGLAFQVSGEPMSEELKKALKGK